MSLHSWLTSLKPSSHRRNRKSSGSSTRRNRQRRLFVEPLEDRRLLAGDLDLSFGTGGIVTTNFIPVANTPGWSDSASSVALQDDGKIVVAGTTQPNGSPLGAISRYKSDGSLDNVFSTDGKISDSRFNSINDVAIQPDGKIVVVGRGYPVNGNLGNFAIGRFDAAGNPDTTFGTNGIVITNPGAYDTPYAVALLSDGKILVTGQSGQPGSEQPVGFTLQQFNADGTVDTTFGSGGLVRTFYSTAEVPSNYGGVGNVAARDVVVQPDGKIVVAGHTLELNNKFALVRYHSNGSLDTSFDIDGRVSTSLGSGKSFATSMALQSDGKVVVGGYFRANDVGSDFDFAIVRYNTDGSLDNTFDGDGKLIVDYGGTHDYVNDVKVQADGAILVTGSVGSSLAVARVNSDGSPDTTFGTNGLVTTAIQSTASGSEVVVQPDGAIVVAGTVNNGNGNQFLNRDFVVVRYNGISNTATPTITLDWTGGTYNGIAFEATGSVLGFDGSEIATPTFTYFVGVDTTGTPLTTAPVDAGSYTVLAEFAGDSLHTSASDTATIVINQRAITVTADDQTKAYGAADPAFTYGVTSGSLVVTDAFFGELTREPGENVGSYAINQGSLGLSDNYDLSFVDAELGITRATLTGNATTQDALNMAKQGMLNITVANIQGFANGENADVFLTNASFWITIDDVKYEFVPTSVTKLSDSSISISYRLKNSGLLESFGDALDGARSGATALQAGFAMDSTNYSLSDDFLTRIFSTVK